jgi:hypothetical protein
VYYPLFRPFLSQLCSLPVLSAPPPPSASLTSQPDMRKCILR